MLDLSEAAAEMHRLSDLLDKGLEALRTFSVQAAQAERLYRHAKAAAWVETPHENAGRKLTAVEREATVNSVTADDRYARDVAVGMERAALESVRSRRTQISCWQSLLGAERAEAEFARVAPRYDP
jgi:hypothetical protein